MSELMERLKIQLGRNVRVYISGPITGTDDYMERFKSAEDLLKVDGISVINPAAVNDNLPEDTTYEEYMKMCYVMMNMCDAVYFLKGWEKSIGSNREYGYAIAKSMAIIMEE